MKQLKAGTKMLCIRNGVSRGVDIDRKLYSKGKEYILSHDEFSDGTLGLVGYKFIVEKRDFILAPEVYEPLIFN